MINRQPGRNDLPHRLPPTAWPVPLLTSMLLLAACGKKNEQGDTQKPKAPKGTMGTTTSASKAKTAMTPSMTKKPAMATTAPTKKQPAVGLKTPSRPLTKADFNPTVPKPSYGVVNKLVKSKKVRDVTAWGIKALGGTRFMAAVSGRDKGSSRWWFLLLLLDKASGSWRESWRFMVDKPPFGGNKGVGRVGVELKVGDYDLDGKPEAKVIYRFPTGKTGDGEIRKIAFVNIGKKSATLAARVLISDTCEACPFKQKGYLLVKDRNKDGHPDLVVSRGFYLTIKPEKKGATRTKKRNYKRAVVWLYDRPSDTYKRQWPKGELPPSMRFSFRSITFTPGETVATVPAQEDKGCMAMECLGPWGFPAISRDGSTIAILGQAMTLPTWIPGAGGGDEAATETMFHLVRTGDGKLQKSQMLIGSDILARIFSGSQSQSCLNEVYKSGQGDPRLCEEDPKLVPYALAHARKSIKANIAKVTLLLQGKEFTPLLELVSITKKTPAPTKGMALSHKKAKGNKHTFTVSSYPDSKPLVSNTYTATYDNVMGTAFYSRHFNLIVIQIKDIQPPEETKFKYVILKLPKGPPSPAP